MVFIYDFILIYFGGYKNLEQLKQYYSCPIEQKLTLIGCFGGLNNFWYSILWKIALPLGFTLFAMFLFAPLIRWLNEKHYNLVSDQYRTLRKEYANSIKLLRKRCANSIKAHRKKHDYTKNRLEEKIKNLNKILENTMTELGVSNEKVKEYLEIQDVALEQFALTDLQKLIKQKIKNLNNN